MTGDRFELTPGGPFDLDQSLGFLEDWPAATVPAGATRLRFAYHGPDDWEPVGVSVAQTGDRLEFEVTRPASVTLREDLARVLSVDVDATGLTGVADRDPVVAALLRRRPGLRPVCFWSTWEAACWAVLTQRTSMRVASATKRRIAERLGTTVEVDGDAHLAFPAPRTLLGQDQLPGVPSLKVERIHGLAHAALDGVLTAGSLRDQDTGDALASLCELPGVGPFSAGLILIRGAGAPDVFTLSEPRLLGRMRTVYRLPGDPPDDAYRAIADRWRPYRSWVAFLLRSADEAEIDELSREADAAC